MNKLAKILQKIITPDWITGCVPAYISLSLFLYIAVMELSKLIANAVIRKEGQIHNANFKFGIFLQESCMIRVFLYILSVILNWLAEVIPMVHSLHTRARIVYILLHDVRTLHVCIFLVRKLSSRLSFLHACVSVNTTFPILCQRQTSFKYYVANGLKMH